MKFNICLLAIGLAAFATAGEIVVDAKTLSVEKRDGLVVSKPQAKLPSWIVFSVDARTAGSHRLVVKNLPPKKYFLHTDIFQEGLFTVEQLAEGVDLEFKKGVTKVLLDKNPGTRLEDPNERRKWSQMYVEVTSTRDGTPQPCYFWAPEKAKTVAVPLIVGLHTWSCDIRQLAHYKTVQAEAERRGWAFVGPNFRGPNNTPQGCGSELAVQDIVDAVNFAKGKVKIDERRVYIIGGSGGGHMTLLMMGRHPEVFAAGAAFCPISDIARWHADSLLAHPGREKGYAEMLESACGGTPAAKPSEYAARSPVTWLANARKAGRPVYICTGIHDGWIGSVPVGHTLRAYNLLCESKDRISEDDIAFIEANQKLPPTLDPGDVADPFYKGGMKIHLRRTSGNVRMTLFEGGHSGSFPAGFDFLARQTRGAAFDWSLPEKAVGKAEALTH